MALELRALLPLVDDDAFDAYLVRLDRIAGFISSAETAAPDESDRFADAAWEAGIDFFDAPARNTDTHDHLDGVGAAHGHVDTFREAVIAPWDVQLRREVDALVNLQLGEPQPVGRALGADVDPAGFCPARSTRGRHKVAADVLGRDPGSKVLRRAPPYLGGKHGHVGDRNQGVLVAGVCTPRGPVGHRTPMRGT